MAYRWTLRAAAVLAALSFLAPAARAQVNGGYAPFPFALTTGDCIKALNAYQGQDAGAPCGTGSVGSGTAGQMAQYAGTGTSIAGVTISGDGAVAVGGALTVSKIGGKAVTLANSLTTAGNFALTLTQTNTTNVTLPTTGTLAALGGTNTWSAAQSFTSNAFVGNTAAVSIGGSSNGLLQVATSGGGSNTSMSRWSADAFGANINFGKSRSTTVGTAGTPVALNDSLGALKFSGDDGTNINTVAGQINVLVDGTVASTQVPTRIELSTTTAGGALGLALTLDKLQVATFGGGMTNTHLSTGTNADTVCLSAGGVFLIQAAACTISSMRFKRAMIPLAANDNIGLRTLSRLRPTAFNMIEERGRPNGDINYGRRQVGLIAEDVARADPRLAIYEQDGVTPKSYRQEAVLAMTIKAIQEQQTEITALRDEIKALRAGR